MNNWPHQQGRRSGEQDERSQRPMPLNLPPRYSYTQYPHAFPVVNPTVPQQYLYVPGSVPPPPQAQLQFPIYPYYPQPAAGGGAAAPPPRMRMKLEQPPMPMPMSIPGQRPAAVASSSSNSADDEEQREAQGYVHKCHLCNKSFKRKSWLQRHLLSHSPARHFSCPWCLSKHKRKDNLLQHMKLKHTDYVLQELRLNKVYVSTEGSSKNNIRTLLYEGRLNKDEVKKVLNSLIDRHNSNQ